MQLWSGTLSPFSAKVRLALAEKQIAFELLDLPWTRAALWGDKPEAFRAVSPRDQVPVLVDGDLVIPDSTVICEYLEDRHPEAPLLPADPKDRARCRVLEDDADHALAGFVTLLIREVFMKPDGAGRDAEGVAQAEAGIRATYDRMEAALGTGEYLAGGFSLADIAGFLLVAFASTLGCAPDEGSALAAWNARLRERPAFAAEFAAVLAAAAAA